MNGLLFPGQGSQKIGMGKELYDKFSSARHILEEANDILSYDLKTLMFEGPQEQLTDTKYAQPAIYTCSAMYLEKFKSDGLDYNYVAGHSLGEYNALLAAGVFSFSDGLKLIAQRGDAMSRMNGKGIMAAVMGLNEEELSPFMVPGVVMANLNTKTQIVISGEEAGIKSVTFQVNGENAYGYLKSEKGVHRLVRISPFNAQGKRQTSFVSLDVMPDIEEDLDIEINEDELRIDTYRSSGAGGQHVNKTSSAIRITHLPTGIVVQCQNERSQFQNKDKAMQMLKAKLYLLKQQENQEKESGIRGEVRDINFGNQIRSYVLQPYTMVKDHRTGAEISNAQAVLDGGIDPFINAYLKWINTKPEEEN